MRRAFTLIELIITIGLISVLISISSFSLLSTQRKSTLIDTTTQVVSDLHDQQLKAMTNFSNHLGMPDNYGIYFQPTNYVLFVGDVYSPVDTANFQIDLPPTLQFSQIGFPNSWVVFKKGSGEIKDFNNTQNSLSITDSESGQTKSITLNALGVVSQIQ